MMPHYNFFMVTAIFFPHKGSALSCREEIGYNGFLNPRAFAGGSDVP